MIAGARDIGMSPSIVGSFARKEAELVEVHSCFLDLLSPFFESVTCIAFIQGTEVNKHEVLDLASYFVQNLQCPFYSHSSLNLSNYQGSSRRFLYG